MIRASRVKCWPRCGCFSDRSEYLADSILAWLDRMLLGWNSHEPVPARRQTLVLQRTVARCRADLHRLSDLAPLLPAPLAESSALSVVPRRSGRMAARNAVRNPKRRPQSAALLVGVSQCYALFTIFGIHQDLDRRQCRWLASSELVMSSRAPMAPAQLHDVRGDRQRPRVCRQPGLSARGTALANNKQLNVTVPEPKQLVNSFELPGTGEW